VSSTSSILVVLGISVPSFGPRRRQYPSLKLILAGQYVVQMAETSQPVSASDLSEAVSRRHSCGSAAIDYQLFPPAFIASV
jgi:hypothetical protein